MIAANNDFFRTDYLVYANLCRIKGDGPATKENLNRAIDIYSECGANGWVSMLKKKSYDFQF